MLVLSGTRPLARYLKRVGHSTFHINSSYIGLEWIARGKGIPDGLEINWTKPNNPRSSVDQSRAFLHAAMLGYVFDCTDSYLRLLADIAWLNLSDTQRSILRKSTTRPGGKDYAIWERFPTSAANFDDEAAINLAMVRVLVAWRNKISHQGLDESGEVRLDDEVKQQLIDAESFLADRYGKLSAQGMLEQLSANAPPRRKEIIAIVSATINFVRFVDAGLIAGAIKNEQNLRIVALQEIAKAFIGSKNGPESALRTLWGKNIDARVRRFTAILQEAGFKRDTNGIGLVDDFVDGLASESVETVIELLDHK